MTCAFGKLSTDRLDERCANFLRKFLSKSEIHFTVDEADPSNHVCVTCARCAPVPSRACDAGALQNEAVFGSVSADRRRPVPVTVATVGKNVVSPTQVRTPASETVQSDDVTGARA
jgi:hypothetical protein